MSDIFRQKYYICGCGHAYLLHDMVTKFCLKQGCTCMWFTKKKLMKMNPPEPEAKEEKPDVDA